MWETADIVADLHQSIPTTLPRMSLNFENCWPNWASHSQLWVARIKFPKTKFINCITDLTFLKYLISVLKWVLAPRWPVAASRMGN